MTLTLIAALLFFVHRVTIRERKEFSVIRTLLVTVGSLACASPFAAAAYFLSPAWSAELLLLAAFFVSLYAPGLFVRLGWLKFELTMRPNQSTATPVAKPGNPGRPSSERGASGASFGR